MVGLSRRRIAVNGERVGNPLDLDLLVKRIIVAIAGRDLEVAEPAGHRILKGRVIGDLRPRLTLNRPD